MIKKFFKPKSLNLLHSSLQRGMRVAYNSRENVLLEEKLSQKDPIKLFDEWFQAAKSHPQVIEANAMVLATANKQAIPSARMVLCKGYSQEGFKFFTHYTSRKGEDLNENPNAALTFYWAPFNRSVRIEGNVEKLPISEAEEYFHGRPYASQIGALCSNQSKVIAGRFVLTDKEKELKEKYKEGEVPRPEFWGGYIVKPRSIEFWQGQTDRIHDRIKFFPASEVCKVEDEVTFNRDNGWIYQRLAP